MRHAPQRAASSEQRAGRREQRAQQAAGSRQQAAGSRQHPTACSTAHRTHTQHAADINRLAADLHIRKLLRVSRLPRQILHSPGLLARDVLSARTHFPLTPHSLALFFKLSLSPLPPPLARLLRETCPAETYGHVRQHNRPPHALATHRVRLLLLVERGDLGRQRRLFRTHGRRAQGRVSQLFEVLPRNNSPWPAAKAASS